MTNLNEQTQGPDSLFTTTFEFPWTSPPLSMNQRMHHMAKARITRDIRSLMHAKARHIPDLGRCEVTLTWVVRTRARRDADNLVALLKPLCDGLVDAEIVEDDAPQFMVKHMPIIRYEKDATAHFEFTVTELPGSAA